MAIHVLPILAERKRGKDHGVLASIRVLEKLRFCEERRGVEMGMTPIVVALQHLLQPITAECHKTS